MPWPGVVRWRRESREADEQVSSSALLRCRQASDVFALPGTSAQERSIRLSTNHVRPFIQSMSDYAEVAYTHYSQRHLSVTSTTLPPRCRPHHRSHHGLHSPPHAPSPGARRPRQARLHLRRPRRQSAAAIVPEAVMDSPASCFPDLRQQTDPPTAATGHQGHRQ